LCILHFALESNRGRRPGSKEKKGAFLTLMQSPFRFSLKWSVAAAHAGVIDIPMSDSLSFNLERTCIGGIKPLLVFP
jgi:hypothetical protein